MGTIFIFRNIRIVIYSNDHEPAHIHAISPKGEAKVLLDPVECFFCRGYSERDLKMILKFVEEKNSVLLEVWNEIHS